VYTGVEEIEKLQAALDIKGSREHDLHMGLEKLKTKLSNVASVMPEALGVAEMSGLRQGKQFAAESESFQMLQQEIQNVAEVLEDEQRSLLEAHSPAWATDMTKAADCTQLAALMLLIEGAISDSLAPKKRTEVKREAPAGGEAEAGGEAAAMDEDPKTEEEDVPAAATNGAHGEWLVEGSKYVGMRVRRNVRGDDGKLVGKGNGMIVGWLPAEKSDFYCRETGLPAALWHVRFDDDEVGEEDLEVSEVQAACRDYDQLQAALSSSRTSLVGSAKRPDEKKGEEGAVQEEPADVRARDQADEGVVDMVEAGNKQSKRALWTSSLQRDAWRAEGTDAGKAGSLPRLNYSAAVLCDHALRVFGKRREELSSAPRRKGTKRNRMTAELDSLISSSVGLAAFTESGRKVTKVSYKDHQSDPEDED